MAIVTTLLYELALIAAALWGLPRLGIYIPIPGLVVLALALGAVAIATYRKGSQALEKKAVVGLSSMIGSKAKVVSKIDLEGMVKVKGELWKAQSTGERIDVGEEVTVVGQKRLKLIVHRDSGKSKGDLGGKMYG